MSYPIFFIHVRSFCHISVIARSTLLAVSVLMMLRAFQRVWFEIMKKERLTVKLLRRWCGSDGGPGGTLDPEH